MTDKITAKTIQHDLMVRGDRLFELYVQDFTKRWAPSDRHDAAQFSAELTNIVRVTIRDAQEPLQKHIETLFRALPLSPLFFEKPKNEGT